MKARRVKLRRTGDNYEIYIGNQLVHSMCLDWEKVTDYRLSNGEEVQIKINVEALGKVRKAKGFKFEESNQPQRPPPQEMTPEQREILNRVQHQRQVMRNYQIENYFAGSISQVFESRHIRQGRPEPNPRNEERRIAQALEEIPPRVMENIHQAALNNFPSLAGIRLEEFVNRYPGQIIEEYRTNPEYRNVRQQQREQEYVQQVRTGGRRRRGNHWGV